MISPAAAGAPGPVNETSAAKLSLLYGVGVAGGWGPFPLGGRKNKAQVGDMGFDGRIFPVSALDNVKEASADELKLEERFYAMQVKQKDKAGRPDIDAFETAMRRAKCEKGFFVSFDYSSDAVREIDRFFREEHRIIVPLTVQEILDEEIARKLA